MRRFVPLVLFLALTIPMRAQMGKQPFVRAGTPEDHALQEIDAATDPTQRIALLDKFMADYGKGDVALLAYERYVSAYFAVKNNAKAFEYGDKALELDPDNFNIAYALVTGAAEANDAAHAFTYGEDLGQMVDRYRAEPAPEDTDEATWEQRKKMALDNARDRIAYVEQLLYTIGYQTKDPAGRAALLERYVAAFPDSPFTPEAEVVVTDSYDQAQNPAKKVAFAQKRLAHDPNDFRMLVVLADHWASQRQELDKAEQYARKALELIPQAEKPAYVTDEQWTQRKNLQMGVAWSALGQVLVHSVRDREAVDALKEASPFLKPYPFYYGRNLYFLGFSLARMRRTTEARTVLTEAVSVDSPYRQLAQETLDKLGGARRRQE